MLERWTRFVLRVRVVVLAIWLAALGVGVYAAMQLPTILANSLAVPATDSQRAQDLLQRRFGERPDGTFTVVFPTRAPGDAKVQADVRRSLARAARDVPTGRAGPLRRGSGIIYGDVVTGLELRVAKTYTDVVRRGVSLPGSGAAYVTGQPAIQHDLDPAVSADLRTAEAIAVPIALAVLIGVFGLSLAVLIPFVFAAGTIAATLALVYVVAHYFPTASYVTNLVVLIGLGLAIDYSLLIVHRFRRGLEEGLSPDDAIVRTTATAGRAVVFSGAAVAIGLALLLLVPVPFVRSLGVGGLLIPLVSIAGALTLQPVLLALVGRRAMPASRAHPGHVTPDPSTPRARAAEHGFWALLARSVMRRPVLFLATGGTVLIACALPAASLDLTPGSISSIPASSDAAHGARLLRDGLAAGAVTPTQILVDPAGRSVAPGSAVRVAIERLADELARDPEVLVVASGRRPPYVSEDGRYARVIVAGRHELGHPATRRFVRRLRDSLIPAARFPDEVDVAVGGAPAQGVDFLRRAYRVFPWLVLAVLAVTYLVLMRAFRSLLLPLKAVLLNALTVAAVYGLLVVVFQWGLGADLLGLQQGEVEGWVPIFLFAVLFGLSMDYEVFLVMPMREAWDEIPDNERAVASGLERTGRVVTAAALIMVAAFSGFVFGSVAGLQQFGVGLTLGVLLDATIVRMVLVPSLMTVLGRYNWWLPRRVASVLRVAPSPL